MVRDAARNERNERTLSGDNDNSIPRATSNCGRLRVRERERGEREERGSGREREFQCSETTPKFDTDSTK